MKTYCDDIKQVTLLPLPWEKLQGCNILVTGATGLIGNCLVEVLMQREVADFHVWAMGRSENRAHELFAPYSDNPRFHFLCSDVTKPLDLDIAFHYIIHAASPASPAFFAAQPVETMLSNILGVRNLMDYGLQHGLQRFLYISSGEVYGEGDGHDFSESDSGYVDSMSPRSCYPSSKRAAETLCASYSSEYGVDFVVARPCHTYGPHFTEQDNRVYAQFIRNVLHGQDIVMKSTGEQYRSWCYVVDAASALLHILLKGDSGQAYNVADPSSDITIRQLAEMVASIGGRQVVMQLPEEQERKGYNPVKRSVFNTDKLRALGWKIEGSMSEKMERTIERCKQIDN